MSTVFPVIWKDVKETNESGYTKRDWDSNKGMGRRTGENFTLYLFYYFDFLTRCINYIYTHKNTSTKNKELKEIPHNSHCWW
jgi:hypothetical protein